MGTRLHMFPKLTLPKLTLPDVALAAIALFSLFSAFVLPPARATPALSALGVFILGFLCDAVRRDRVCKDAMKERGAWLSAAAALRRLRKEEAEKLWGRAGFPCGSFEFLPRRRGPSFQQFGRPSLACLLQPTARLRRSVRTRVRRASPPLMAVASRNQPQASPAHVR
jgi:hypothetical protein